MTMKYLKVDCLLFDHDVPIKDRWQYTCSMNRYMCTNINHVNTTTRERGCLTTVLCHQITHYQDYLLKLSHFGFNDTCTILNIF